MDQLIVYESVELVVAGNRLVDDVTVDIVKDVFYLLAVDEGAG